MEFLFPCDYSTLQIQKQLEQNHLTLALFNTAPGDINAGEWGLSALPGREHEAHADIDLALEMHWRSIVNKSMLTAGVVPAGEDAERYRAVFIDNLRYAADRFALHGKRILVEALSPDVKPHYLFSSQYQALAIVEEVARDNVFIQLDTFHGKK
ncbi:TIM barrel protein [Escherichia coli]